MMVQWISPARFWSALALSSALLSAPTVATAQSGAGPEAAIRLDDAIRIADRARQSAAKKNLAVAIVIVNREGRVILSQRMDNASYVSLDLAEAKARTAAALGIPTRYLEQQVDAGKPSVLSAPGVVMIAGGVPFKAADRIIAGIGISGASSADDDAIASAAVLAAE